MQLFKKISKPSTLALAMMLTFFSLVAGANDKGEQLRRSMAEIALLNSQMTQRKADVVSTREALYVKLEEIKKEAFTVLRKNKINTVASALEHPRIYYNMMLVAEIEAYIGRYTQKIAYYRIACDRLSYLYQQADDDLKIVNTLSDLKIDALAGQTEKILNRYLSDAQTIAIDPAALTFDKPEKILAHLKWVKK